ncbi:hypothetical protein AB685_17435 [Bacillus sp. LL01]|nr:hypothetical protein AB685_17435 [Bacillus sp. LL01]
MFLVQKEGICTILKGKAFLLTRRKLFLFVRLFSQRLLLSLSKKSAIGLFTKKNRPLDFSRRKIGLWIFHSLGMLKWHASYLV